MYQGYLTSLDQVRWWYLERMLSGKHCNPTGERGLQSRQPLPGQRGGQQAGPDGQGARDSRGDPRCTSAGTGSSRQRPRELQMSKEIWMPRRIYSENSANICQIILLLSPSWNLQVFKRYIYSIFNYTFKNPMQWQHMHVNVLIRWPKATSV